MLKCNLATHTSHERQDMGVNNLIAVPDIIHVASNLYLLLSPVQIYRPPHMHSLFVPYSRDNIGCQPLACSSIAS